MLDQNKKAFSEAMLRYAVIENHNREMAEIPSDDELAKLHTFSERHNARMKAIFASEARKAALKTALGLSKRIAAVFAISIAVLFAALLTNRDVRAVVSRTIVEWFEGFTSFRFQGEEATNINVEWIPDYLPDGFHIVAEYSGIALNSVEYIDQYDVIIYFDYALGEGRTIATDNEHSDYHVVLNGEIEYNVFSADSNEYKSKVIWGNDGYSFSLMSTLNADELLKMASSVTQKNN